MSFIYIEELDKKVIFSSGKETGTAVLDMTGYFNQNFLSIEERAPFFEDESHFNKNGNTFLADMIYNDKNFKEIITKKQ